ncbi:MAG TPA: trypsin-like peptidase domain-containing protein [Anaerolineales bacterium]
MKKTRRERWQAGLKRILTAIKRAAPFAAGVLAAFLALLAYNTFFPGARPLSTQDVNELAAQVLGSATPAPAYSEQVYQVIRPSLVLVQTRAAAADGKEEDGLGSGVVIDDAGDILTSLHVVANVAQIQLTFADGTQSDAQVVTQQPENDIAVVRANTPPAKLIPATLGNPNAMQVGDEAYVVGNPLGLYSSMSAGVISGFNRTFQTPNSGRQLKGLIQIDAAVNPGNSGGPLLNRYGEVIGIVTGIVNPTGQEVFIGIGFAVPINVAGGALGSPLY